MIHATKINLNSFFIGATLFIGTFTYFNGLILNAGTIPGFGLDPFFCMFVIHTNALKILSGQFSDLANLPFFFPKAHTLAFSDPLLFHSIFYSLFYSLTGAKDLSIRLMFFGFFILNWISCSVFLFCIKRKFDISIFVGWLFAFSLFFQVQSAHYQNLIVFPIFLSIIPFFKPTLPNFIKFLLVFLGILITLISNLYFFIYCLMIYSIIAILYALYRGKRYMIQSRFSFLGVVCALLVSIPLIQLYYSAKIDFPEIVGVRNFDEKISFSARPWDFFRVLYPPSIYLNLKKYFVSFEFERSNFSGLAGMIIFTGLTIPYFRISRFKLLRPQALSLVLFSLGVFLVSGPLVFGPIYKFVSYLIPGLSEIRAVGRAGLIINLSYAISTFLFLSGSFSKNFQNFFLFGLLSFFLISERITDDFPSRFVTYHMPINQEALELIKKQNIKDLNAKSIFVITEKIEDFIRIPFYLSVESGISSVNGYSGYNPIEWNHVGMFFERTSECRIITKENEYLFDHANYLLLEKVSPFYQDCLGDLKSFHVVANSFHFTLLSNNHTINHAP